MGEVGGLALRLFFLYLFATGLVGLVISNIILCSNKTAGFLFWGGGGSAVVCLYFFKGGGANS